MADEIETSTPARTDDDSDVSSSSSEDEAPNQWLATNREKRSTAGNRLSTLLQQEGEDDELELLFAEDEDDEGFEIADDDSDVQMDSSDDDEDQGPSAEVDDLEGERELQKAAKAERAAKKRKTNDLPPAFRKRVKIDTTATSTASSTPPRPKKKSERASWIPTADDAPVRASARGTTKKSKEHLYAQMIDRERRRLKQLENMEKAAAKKEAEKQPALTQEDRLAEAARVEKRNAKSLNRWEEAEKLREEEQKAKLAALNNRRLEGPVITLWSGKAEWVGGILKQVGKDLFLEDPKEKPKKKKAIESEAVAGDASKASTTTPAATTAVEANKPATTVTAGPTVAPATSSTPSKPVTSTTSTTSTTGLANATTTTTTATTTTPAMTTAPITTAAAATTATSATTAPPAEPVTTTTKETPSTDTTVPPADPITTTTKSPIATAPAPSPPTDTSATTVAKANVPAVPSKDVASSPVTESPVVTTTKVNVPAVPSESAASPAVAESPVTTVTTSVVRPSSSHEPGGQKESTEPAGSAPRSGSTLVSASASTPASASASTSAPISAPTSMSTNDPSHASNSVAPDAGRNSPAISSATATTERDNVPSSNGPHNASKAPETPSAVRGALPTTTGTTIEGSNKSVSDSQTLPTTTPPAKAPLATVPSTSVPPKSEPVAASALASTAPAKTTVPLATDSTPNSRPTSSIMGAPVNTPLKTPAPVNNVASPFSKPISTPGMATSIYATVANSLPHSSTPMTSTPLVRASPLPPNPPITPTIRPPTSIYNIPHAANGYPLANGSTPRAYTPYGPPPAPPSRTPSMPLDGSAPLPGFLDGIQYHANLPNQPPRMVPSPTTPYAFTPPTPQPPAIEHSVRNLVILENFDEAAIKDKQVQTKILTGKKFVRMSKLHPEVCAITGVPAKYRDPSTGLPYCNAHAYKEIQKLKRGEYKWSGLLGAYVGPAQKAARGVPERFA